MPISDEEKKLRKYLESVIEYDAKLKELLNRGRTDCQAKMAQDLGALQTYIKSFATNVKGVYRKAVADRKQFIGEEGAVGEINKYTREAIETLNSCMLTIRRKIESTESNVASDSSAEKLFATCNQLLFKISSDIATMKYEKTNCPICKLADCVATQLPYYNRRVIPENLNKEEFINDIVNSVKQQGGFGKNNSQ